MLTLKRIHQPLATLLRDPHYASLIYPPFLSLIPTISSVSQWVVVEARLKDELVGLVICEVLHLNKIAHFESLVVKEGFRKQGIGEQLLTYTQTLLIEEEQMKLLEWEYEQSAPFAYALERMLAALQWGQGRLFLIRSYFNALTFNPPWLHFPFRLLPTMEIFSWNELTTEDRERVEYLALQGRFLPYLSPLRSDPPIHLPSSLGLRKEGNLVGWSITRLENPTTLRYSSLFIDQDFLHTGYAIQLLAESIRRQQSLQIPYSLFEINVREIDPSWWRFIKKRLLPYAKRIEQIKKATRFIK